MLTQTTDRIGVDLSASRFLSIHPVMFFLFVVVLLWLGTLVGGHLRLRRQKVLSEETGTFKTLEGAVLALLGLLLGFTFSMGVNRYDQRKNLEIAEANDITNAWVRTATLPEPVRSTEQALMRQYVPVRLAFLTAGTSEPLINASLRMSASLQAQMWQVASIYVRAEPNPVSAQYLTSLTDLVDVTENRTAAFENRIPMIAWIMLLFIAFIGSLLVGVGIGTRSQLLRLILPIVVAAALSLTLDLDSPRSGLIRVHQHSLERVAGVIESGPTPQ